MVKPKLPASLRARIMKLFGNGYTSIEIFDEVADEAKDYVGSHEELARCIAGIKGKYTLKMREEDKRLVSDPSRPRPKNFDDTQHRALINKLDKDLSPREFESACRDIVFDVLLNYENFERVEDGPNFRGTPFDFFGFKDGAPYIIEFKSSLHYFHSPGETQKRRMQELLRKIQGLKIALLQVKLKKAQYRILYNQEMDFLFEGREAAIKPIEKWIRERL